MDGVGFEVLESVGNEPCLKPRDSVGNEPPCLKPRDSALFMYSLIASSLSIFVSALSTHASHFALDTKSRRPGRGCSGMNGGLGNLLVAIL